MKSTEGTVSKGMTDKYDVSMIKEMVAASDECCIATFIASDCNDQRSGFGSSTIGRDRPFILVGTMRRRRECGGYRCRCQAFRENTADGTNLRGDAKHDDRRRCSQQRSTYLSEGCGHGTTTDIAFVRCHRYYRVDPASSTVAAAAECRTEVARDPQVPAAATHFHIIAVHSTT